MLLTFIVISTVCILALWIFIEIYNFFEGETFVSDIFLEMKLKRLSLTYLDQLAGNNPNKADAIVSLTSIPSRLPHIHETLKSLLYQHRLPKKIFLNLPKYSTRENCQYCVPDDLFNLATVEIVRCEDYGPATKFIPTLNRVNDDQLVIVVDDDRIYSPYLIADLEKAASISPDTAYGLSGWIVPKDCVDRPTTILSNLFMRPPAPIRARRLTKPKQVDILQGLSGYAIRPRFFEHISDLLDYSRAPEAAFFVDDVWMSAHCSRPKAVLPTKRSNHQAWKLSSFYKNNSLGLINRGDGKPENRKNSIMIKYFSDRWMVSGRSR